MILLEIFLQLFSLNSWYRLNDFDYELAHSVHVVFIIEPLQHHEHNVGQDCGQDVGQQELIVKVLGVKEIP